MDFVSLFRKKKDKKPAGMEYVSVNKSERYVDMDYMIQWRAEDGSLRISEKNEKQVFDCDNFSAAGKAYSGWQQLCAEKVGEYHTFTDIYGRQIFAFERRFPCFDSFDRMYEKRYYRWFYIREGDSLCCVYYEDEQKTIEVTEDLRHVYGDAWKAMKEMNWQG